MTDHEGVFADHLARWGLAPDGPAIVTRGSRLLPVRRRGEPAMLKVAFEADEKRGGLMMAWWAGRGAARVLGRAGDALLLERAQGTRSLGLMARRGGDDDDEATRTLCAVVARLHAHDDRAPPDLIPLEEWFRALWPAAAEHGGILARSAAAARELLATPRGQVPLHGDIHHDNVLDFGPRGWLAIDPKRLRGERGYDYANVFCNPDLASATAPGRLARRAAIVVEAAGLERERLLAWVLAYAGLSAAWSLGDGVAPRLACRVATQAAALGARSGVRAAR